MFAIIECLHHASGVWTRLWQQEVVLEDADASIALTGGRSVTSAHHFRPVVLQVLHEARLVRLTHEVVLCVMPRRRATLTVLRGVEETRARSVRIRRKVRHVTHLAILTAHGHKAAVLSAAWWHTISVKVTLRYTAHRASAVREFTSLVLFIWLVQHIGVTISRGLTAAADGRQVASIPLRRGAVSALREVTDVELRVQRGQVVACVSYEGLLAHVAYTA